MRKFICIVMVTILFVSIGALPVYASNSNHDSYAFSYVNQNGELVTTHVDKSNNIATSRVYINGILAQKSTADASSKTILTEIYDQKTILLKSTSENHITSGFINTTIHKPVSTKKITIKQKAVTLASIYDEPVLNDGLSPSVYGDGYYLLGSTAGPWHAPDIYAYLFRKYTMSYIGETSTYVFGFGDTLSAITAYLSLIMPGSLVFAAIGVIVFTASQIVAYTQSIKLATYNFHYDYRVRIYGSIYFDTFRGKLYWQIANIATGVSKWEYKGFNYGFSPNNGEMIEEAFYNYFN